MAGVRKKVGDDTANAGPGRIWGQSAFFENCGKRHSLAKRAKKGEERLSLAKIAKDAKKSLKRRFGVSLRLRQRDCPKRATDGGGAINERRGPSSTTLRLSVPPEKPLFAVLCVLCDLCESKPF
ncbi:MAG: hypothetical protein P8106_11970 [Gammaproteobacteria bacterium]